tara:strand:- start:8258 stop:8530 length:273 start_codon:yes stop_codon:yes gene_type:complete
MPDFGSTTPLKKVLEWGWLEVRFVIRDLSQGTFTSLFKPLPHMQVFETAKVETEGRRSDVKPDSRDERDSAGAELLSIRLELSGGAGSYM